MKKFYLMLMAFLISTIAANAAEWYLVGANYGWNDNASYKLTQSATNPDEYSIQVASLSGEIKIKEKGTWSTSFSTNGQKLKEGVLYHAGMDGNNIVVDGTINDATLTINTANRTVMAVGAAQENDYDVVYLVGDFGTGWSETLTNYPLTLKEGTTNTWVGHYTLTAATTYFKMKAGTLVYGTGGGDIRVELGTEYTASQSGNAFILSAGEYDFTFVLEKNADTGVLTVTSEAPVTYPETVYAVGNLDGKAFLATSTMALTTVDAENGLYEGTINLTGADGTAFGYFAFCTSEGADWGDLGSRYGPQQADTEVVPGEAMPLFGGDKSFKAPIGKYNVAVDLKNTTVTVTEVVNSFDVVYLVGNLDGTEFNDNITTHPLAIKAGTDNTYTGHYTFATTAYIKLRAGNLVLGTGADDVNVVSGTEYTASPAGNAYVLAAGEYDFTVVIGQADRTATFTATATVTPTFPDNLYLIGNFTGSAFAANVTVALVNEGNGIYTATDVEFTANPEDAAKSFFQLCTATGATADDWTGVGTRYMAENADQAVESEVEYTILPGTDYPNSWYVTPGTYDVKVNLDAMTLTVVSKAPVITYPELVVIGEFCGWHFATAIPMTRQENVYTATMERLNAGQGFKIAEVAEDDAWKLNWGGSAPAGSKDPEILVLDTPTNAYQDSSINFQVPNDIKDVTITFTYDTADLGSLKVNGTDATGIDNIAIDNADNAPYYNLQGMRVDCPVPGALYIHNGKKLIFR